MTVRPAAIAPGPRVSRRRLVRTALVGGSLAALARPTCLRAAGAARRLRVAVLGLGRGLQHVAALLQLPDVEISHLAEVDPQRLAVGMKTVEASHHACRGVTDFRTILDDSAVDAVFVALPNFWHTPATLLALEAGKHVYVEKPGSHDPREAEWIVAGARRHGRHVQMGNQRRTWMRDAIAALHGGAIGTVRFGRSFYLTRRKALAADRQPPAGIDLDLWQGPVPDDPDHAPGTLAHYDWHFFWHWGNGELGNNGVHFLDILRWGLRVDRPLATTYTGGRYWHDDRQETPDTGTAAYDFGHCGCEWVQSSCHPRPAEKPLAEAVFYGDGGTLAVARDSWTVFDPEGRQRETGKSSVAGSGDVSHVGNFLAAVRDEAALASPIEEGQKSAMLCHLGNIAWRTGTVVRCDPASGSVIDNPAALRLWGRPAYRPGWGIGG